MPLQKAHSDLNSHHSRSSRPPWSRAISNPTATANAQTVGTTAVSARRRAKLAKFAFDSPPRAAAPAAGNTEQNVRHTDNKENAAGGNSPADSLKQNTSRSTSSRLSWSEVFSITDPNNCNVAQPPGSRPRASQTSDNGEATSSQPQQQQQLGTSPAQQTPWARRSRSRADTVTWLIPARPPDSATTLPDGSPVLWPRSPRPSHSRKRARSSSPVSSSPMSTIAAGPNNISTGSGTGSAGASQLSALCRSPTTGLWERYGVDGPAARNVVATSAGAAALQQQQPLPRSVASPYGDWASRINTRLGAQGVAPLSPQSRKQMGLRRAATCAGGMGWSKRRRVEFLGHGAATASQGAAEERQTWQHPHQHQQTPASPSKRVSMACDMAAIGQMSPASFATIKTSIVAQVLEAVHGHLEASVGHPSHKVGGHGSTAPSSSSPSPAARAAPPPRCSVDAQQQQQQQKLEMLERSQERNLPELTMSRQVPQAPTEPWNREESAVLSSDYGGDDFDNLDEATLLAIEPSQSVLNDAAPQNQVPTKVSPVPPPPPPLQDSGDPFVDNDDDVNDDDEFNDLDDNVFDDLLCTPHPSNRQSMTSPSKLQQESLTGATSHLSRDVGQQGFVFQEKQDGSRPPIEFDEFGYDEFGADDVDFDAVERAVAQATTSRNISQHHSISRIIQRYLVTKVVNGFYQNTRSGQSSEVVSEILTAKCLSRKKDENISSPSGEEVVANTTCQILVVEVEETKEIRTICLRDDWIDTPVVVGAYVHVIGLFEMGKCIIDNSRHILILHPDQLISATVVADSFSCTRRAVLQDRVKSTSDASPPLVYGSILHEVFQEAMIANQWSSAFLGSVIDHRTQQHVQDLFVIKTSLEDARSHLRSKMGILQSWAELFVNATPRPTAIVAGRNGDRATMCVTKLLDVEEHVWSPMYGLKGNIDATVEVVMDDGRGGAAGRRTLTVPLEVKTGKRESSAHQAQTVLYNLLLSDRYDIDVAYGLLYYMETSTTMRIPAIRHELRHMIMQRNRLACHLRDRNVQQPEMKRNKQVCGKCFAQTSCFIYHKLADDGNGETSDMGSKFDEVVGHLGPVHKEFFLRWERLLTLEEKENQKHKRELWTMLGYQRERLGRCLAGVVVENGSQNIEQDTDKVNRYRYTFIKDPSAGSEARSVSFLDSQLGVGEPIVVSDEKGHFALAIGFVTSVQRNRISVAVDRRLHNARTRQPGFDPDSNQVFDGIMHVGTSAGSCPARDAAATQIRYRIDKDEFNNGMATVRNNLVQLMARSPGGDHIRRLVVDLEAPRFRSVATQYTVADLDSLNTDQKAAIEKVMSAQDYALVLGMPGTGKTTTISHIIRALVLQGKSVLLTSYTHTAVDNILLKFKHDKIPILRLGAAAKVHAEVQDFAMIAGRSGAGLDTFEAIHAAWYDTPIVATTCLGITHALFATRTFDYCIVDEASQITLPVCVGPIRMATRFVLVGDHYQLPPLVQNDEARRGGLDVSLFKLLSDAHPAAVATLSYQYRMCENVMSLSNSLIYAGRLKCGYEALRTLALHVPNMAGLRRHHYAVEDRPPGDVVCTAFSDHSTSNDIVSSDNVSCWLRELLQSEARVRFVNTDGLGSAAAERAAAGSRIVNSAEVSIVSALVAALVTVGIPTNEIGVMTHYRSQLALLRHAVSRRLGGASTAAVEMHTADRFQGRDKDVVVLSLVRCNKAGSLGALLKDWRRINVAFTRAKSKLLVIGSLTTLRGKDPDPTNVTEPAGSGKGHGDSCRGGKGPNERVAQVVDPGVSTDVAVDVGDAGGQNNSHLEMVCRFVRLMEQRDWVFNLPESALTDHFFEDVQGTALPATVLAAADGEEGDDERGEVNLLAPFSSLLRTQTQQ